MTLLRVKRLGPVAYESRGEAIQRLEEKGYDGPDILVSPSFKTQHITSKSGDFAYTIPDSQTGQLYVDIKFRRGESNNVGFIIEERKGEERRYRPCICELLSGYP
jgi:hypothetical protein